MTERPGTIDWARDAQGPAGPDPLLVTDLLSDAGTLIGLLRQTLADQQWLDAFLLAAGLDQLVEDRLHSDPMLLHRAASYLRGRPGRAAHLAGAAAGAGGAVLRCGTSPARRRLSRAHDALTPLTVALAGQVVGHAEPGSPAIVPAAIAAVAADLGGDRVRVPACFHSFDQYPDDVAWLVREFLRRFSADERPPGAPLCVVGVRTSGCYLAPLHAAALRAGGGGQVQVLTYRPGRPFLRRERAVLKAVARAGGMVLVTDDPPASGTSLATTAEAIAAAGVPDARIVFLLSVFTDTAELPARLSRWPAVVQPRAEWSVRRRLTVQPVTRALAILTGPHIEIGAVQPLGPPVPAGLAGSAALPASAGRGHARELFDVQMLDSRAGEMTRRRILAEGAGLGYLGRQGVAVARALPGRVPHVYGFADGLLYRDWLPPGPAGLPGAELAGTIVDYVTARQAALPAAAASGLLGGRDPVWEVTARLLSAYYGRASLPARPLLLEPLMRRLLAHGHPAVIDGKTGHRHWLTDPADGTVRKVDFYQRGFGHLGLPCYDPVFDLAGAAADPPGADFEARLRGAYQRASGQLVDAERWLLYRLAQLWRLRRAGDLDQAHAGQRAAAAIHDYLAGLYLRGLAPATGPLVALDLDGVLECDPLGYPATSPSGALALRALIAHGYRPVLATGRSAAEVRDRCTAFGLAGGVAEYGAALVCDGATVGLLAPDGQVSMAAIRAELAGRPGVELDPRYRHSVRARAGGGPLPAELLAGLAPAIRPGVRVVQGQGQTDFVAAGADKGSGLRALADRLAQPGCAMAVGDTASDLPLFECAALARAPRNARLGDADGGIRLTRHAYQAGLLDACAELVGHRPGRCPSCRPPAFAPRTRALLAILDLRANGMASVPGGTAAAYRWLIGRAA